MHIYVDHVKYYNHTVCSASYELNIVVLYFFIHTHFKQHVQLRFHACYPTAQRFRDRIKASEPPQIVMDRPNPSTDRSATDPGAPAPLRDPCEREKPQASGETSVVRRERDDGTLPGSPSQQQLPQDLHPVVLLERNRRIEAEQQIEAQKQVNLELARLLELERQKFKRQARISTVSAGPGLRRGDSQSSLGSILKRRDSQSSVGSIPKRRDSQSSGIRRASQGSWSEIESGREDKIEEEDEEEESEKVY